MKKSLFRTILLLVVILPAYLTFFASKNQVKAMSSFKDQVTNAQLSFFARISSYNGSSLKVSPSGAPNLYVTNLFVGDSLSVAAGLGSSAFAVRDIGDTTTIDLSSAIGLTVPNGYVVATRSGIHTISFTPSDFGGATEHLQFLIKTTNVVSVAGTTPYFKDGMPDQDGFDIGGSTPACTTVGCMLRPSDVTCPYTTGIASIGTTLVIASDIGSSVAGGTYNVIDCAYSGATSKIGIGGSMVVGIANGPQLINPTSSTSRTFGVADIYSYGIRQLDNSGNQIDLVFGRIAIDDSVRVSAVVDPTLSFTIAANAVAKCNAQMSVPPAFATPNALAFGPIILESTLNNLSQLITVTTNSVGGYVVQAFESNPLTMTGTAATIPNTAAIATGPGAAWPSVTTVSGFGYSMEVGTTRAGAILGIGSTANYRSFGIGFANAATVLNNPNPSVDTANICYRISATISQPAGEYETSVSYIATATF